MPHLIVLFKKNRLTCILVAISLLSFIFNKLAVFFPHFIEVYYSQGINRYYRQAISHLCGLFPFSVGEALLLVGILYIIVHTLLFLFYLIKSPRLIKKHLSKWLKPLIHLSLILWILFSLTWQPNYARLPLETIMQLDTSHSSPSDLTSLYSYLITQLNELAPKVERDSNGFMTITGGYQDVFNRSSHCYKLLSEDFPVFRGSFGRPKAIALSYPMLYTHLTGVYSLTGEPNINKCILPQSLPATTLHEMAHQRGFAPEDECNFIATLACLYSEEADFKYSGYLLALAHTSQTLYRTNPEALSSLNQQISPSVLADIIHNNDFWSSFTGPVEKVSSSVNDSYLKANGVADGEASYGRMVDLLLAYYNKKQGSLTR